MENACGINKFYYASEAESMKTDKIKQTIKQKNTKVIIIV